MSENLEREIDENSHDLSQKFYAFYIMQPRLCGGVANRHIE